MAEREGIFDEIIPDEEGFVGARKIAYVLQIDDGPVFMKLVIPDALRALAKLIEDGEFGSDGQEEITIDIDQLVPLCEEENHVRFVHWPVIVRSKALDLAEFHEGEYVPPVVDPDIAKLLSAEELAALA